MAVQVENVTTASTGKSLRVMLGGKWYGAALDSGLNGMKGQMIEAEIETGKYGPWIKGYAKVAAPGASSPPVTPSGLPPVAAPQAPRYAEQSSNVAPWWMPFVSNCVAHSIAAGHIQNPEGIRAWAIAARNAANACVAVTPPTTDDDIPFN